MQKYAVEATEQKKTRYKNERAFPQSFVVIDNGTPTRFSFAPGEEKAVPSMWDYAIHKIQGQTIQGGLAPQLTNLDRPELRLAEHLDSEAQARKDAQAALVTAQAQKARAEQEAMLAAARIAQAEADKAKSEKAAAAPPPSEEKKK